MTRPFVIIGGLWGLLLLAGCSKEQYQVNPDAPPVSPAAAPAKTPLPQTTTSDTPDPMVGSAGDPLLGDSSPDGPSPDGPSPADSSPADSSPSRPSSDPLISEDPLEGPSMPTEHSHWLRGHLRSAHVTVLLNNSRQGVYYGIVDRDITMRLRKGINSVTFIYVPNNATSSAQMEVLESEHHPPIPPLVTFQSPPPPEDGTLKPVTQTFSFVAN